MDPEEKDDPVLELHDDSHKFHEEEENTGKWGAFWWVLSVGVHIAAIFCLIYFTPLRKWFFGKERRAGDIEVSERRMTRMVAALFEVQTRRLKEKVQELKDIILELESMRDNRYERYAQERTYMLSRGGVSDLPPLEPKEAMGSPGPDYNVPLKDKGVVELYDAALLMEKTTYGFYRQLRASELARIQYLSLKVAHEATRVAIPEHPELNIDALLYSDIKTAKDPRLQQLKDELHKASSEVSAIVAAAQRMLDLANDLVADDIGATIGYGTGGSGPTGGGAGDEMDPSRQRDEIFQGYSPPAPDAFQHAWGVGVGPVVHRNELYPNNAGADLGRVPPAPGRKLMRGGIKANWMYVDTWYIIGPFPNPNRENLDKKFPPESGIDLDATYIGAGGRRLRWHFRQSYSVCIYPHLPDNYMIYYAYTQIHSDKDQDLWCIFGSDDYGKTWLLGNRRDEDELIYASGKTPHPWIPDRAYKKVHFRKGANPILFKLENAWGRTGYSMCVYLGKM